MATQHNPQRFRRFIAAFTGLVERAGNDEKRLHAEGKVLLADIVQNDDWLPESCAQPHPEFYQQYLLHCDPLERFSEAVPMWFITFYTLYLPGTGTGLTSSLDDSDKPSGIVITVEFRACSQVTVLPE